MPVYPFFCHATACAIPKFMIKIRDFKEIPYDELEALNLEAKSDVQNHVDDDTLREKYLRYLHD